METKSFRQRIIDLGIGEELTISVDEVGYTTIRSYASDLGFAFNRTYSTHRNKVERTYTITRRA